jgi:hypothetical protein
MQLVYKESNVLIYFHEDYKVLHLKWLETDCKDKNFEVMAVLENLTIELEVEGWLFDTSNCRAFRIEGIEDNIEGFAASLKNSNLKRYARIASKDLGYEYTIKEYIEHFNKKFNLGLEVECFTDEAEAIAWIFRPINRDN